MHTHLHHHQHQTRPTHHHELLINPTFDGRKERDHDDISGPLDSIVLGGDLLGVSFLLASHTPVGLTFFEIVPDFSFLSLEKLNVLHLKKWR